VDRLTLTVRPGEIFGFLGPNGAGKTTTIKLIVGILKPDAGRILVDGKDNQREALASKAVTAYVPDEPEIYERLTGLEYLNFIGDVYGVAKKERLERVERWLEAFELRKAVGDPIQTYSHGMRQKIVLTGALLVEPRIFVLDEPMVGLDPRSAHSSRRPCGPTATRAGRCSFRRTSWRSPSGSATASGSSTTAAWPLKARWTSSAGKPRTRLRSRISSSN
jgi:ABC-type multidrug transport system ATPase subunit